MLTNLADLKNCRQVKYGYIFERDKILHDAAGCIHLKLSKCLKT